jgi:hypothetical protein
MTTYFWVAPLALNWNNTVSAWSTTSGGGPVAAFPIAGDTAVFDGGSSFTCTINVAISVAVLDCDHGGAPGPFTGTIMHNNLTATIVNGTAAGTLRFSSAMNYANTGTTGSLFTFTHTSGTAQITSAGQRFAAITANCPGGTVQPQDNLRIDGCPNALLTITAGTWDNAGAGGGSLTLTACAVNSSGSTARTINLGGLVKLGGNITVSTNIWNFTTTTSLTFVKNAANVEVIAPSSAIAGIFMTPGTVNPTPFNTLTFDTLSSPCILNWVAGTTAIQTWVVNPGWAVTFSSNTTVTVGSVFNWVGTPALPVGFATVGPVSCTISCSAGSGTCSLKWGVLCGVGASGAGVTFNTTDTLMVGQCPNWLPGPPIDSALPGQLATAVWQDLLSSSDFTTSASVGALVKAMSSLQFTVPAMARGTVGASSSTTSIVTSAFDPPGAAANQFANGVVVFDKTTTTTALRGQRALISASSNAATPTLTVGALTTAPVSGDTFTVV